VLLGVRERTQFPMILYRENCADAALDESDIAPRSSLVSKSRMVS
jgi:5-dehydro-2-deoxygluconokinase